jgi:hypothetical protein
VSDFDILCQGLDQQPVFWSPEYQVQLGQEITKRSEEWSRPEQEVFIWSVPGGNGMHITQLEGKAKTLGPADAGGGSR